VTNVRPAVFTAAMIAGALLILGGCDGSDSGPRIERGEPLTLTQQDVCDVDLATTPPDVTVHGAGAGDFLADRFSLAGGDFNDDGVGDLLVGAPLADGPDDGRENAGEAYIIFGRLEPQGEIDLRDSLAFSIVGEEPGDNLGFTVAAGDINGDGADDAIVGARFASPNDRANAGTAYVVFGGANTFAGPTAAAALDLANAAPDLAVYGAAPGALLTIALSTGDLDGDAIDDLLIGASGTDGPDGSRLDAGSAIALLGSNSLPETIDLEQETPALTVHGAGAGDSLPNHLAAGDLDGDGREEMIAGAPFADTPDREDAGKAYVIRYTSEGDVLDLAKDDAVTMTGGERKDALGFEVAAGDLDGDGVDDLIVGARDADGPDDSINNGGEIHVMFGGEELPPSVDLNDDESDMLIYSTNPGDSLGFNVSTGDINLDGLADIIAGAPLADGCQNGRFEAGDVYIVFGRPEPVPEAIGLDNAGDLTYLGPNDGDATGFSTTTTDFDGDGRNDVIIGALQADGPEGDREDAGAIYIVLNEGP
jgi:hypothetical protein